MKKDINFIKCGSLLGLVVVLFCSGCTMHKEKEYQFNSIVYSEKFKSIMAAQKVMLVAPASGTDPKRIEKLKSLNLLQIPEDFSASGMIYHSNSDEERLRLLKKALYDPSGDTVVWTLRGGYGSARLIEELKKLPKPKREKIFIGYSDITALHLFLSQHWNWHPIHGPGLDDLLNKDKDSQNFNSVLDIIAKKVDKIEIEHLKPLNQEATKAKRISGPITGGNMTMVQTSLGTDWQIDANHKILFLEDHKEQGYKLDRTLSHFKQAGILKNVKAIVFGDLGDDETAIFALERFAAETKIPIFKTDQFGHTKTNIPMIYNSKSDIVKENDSLEHQLIMHLEKH